MDSDYLLNARVYPIRRRIVCISLLVAFIGERYMYTDIHLNMNVMCILSMCRMNAL